jgi:hypothetical protein
MFKTIPVKGKIHLKGEGSIDPGPPQVDVRRLLIWYY